MRGNGFLMKNKENMDNKGKTKPEKKLRSKLVVCLLYVAVLSAATYAWFTVSNKPKVLNLALVANAAGDLLIADDLGTGPGVYDNELDLKGARQSPVAMEDVLLQPVTTVDVKTFYEPVYDGDRVVDVREITDSAILNQNYVYQKTFYLKAGSMRKESIGIAATRVKYYDILLLGPEQSEDYTGCAIQQLEGMYLEGSSTAANAIRIAFVLDDGQNEIKVYEPNSTLHNSGEFAINALDAKYGGYETIRQPTPGAEFEGGDGRNSDVLFTIREETDVKVTMLVWIEGTDVDCTNSIQMDEIVGNIQFVSQDAGYADR